MGKSKNVLKKALSMITYKKPKDTKEFYIPEIGEGDENQGNQNQGSQNSNTMTDKNNNSQASSNQEQIGASSTSVKIPSNIDENITLIKNNFNYAFNKDIIIREFKIADKYKAFIVYIDGMVDRAIINNFILRPLLKEENFNNKKEACQLDYILENVIETNQADKITTTEDVIYRILSGDTGLYVDNCDYYIFSETKGYEKRPVSPPLVEAVVKGPQEAFNENLRTNVTLIRRIVKDSNLTTEFIKIGKRNKNLCAIVYINGLINPAIVIEVKRRINSLDTDFIIGDGQLEQFIEDSPMSLIPTVVNTERPDKASSHIMEGRLAILTEGTPFAIVVPVDLSALLHSSEDSFLRWQYGTLTRIVRMFAILSAALLPALYIAVSNFHQEMIPTELLIAIAKARENVPFPTIVEVILMEVSFELIREAGVRVPGALGSTIGIIGALILGQAAVQANIVSPILIIIVAVTGLGNFAVPDFSLAFGIRIIRVCFIIAAALLGFYGITLLMITFGVLLLDMKSFGVPFMVRVAPKTRRSFDAFIRHPVWKQERRPDAVNPSDTVRQPEISREWTKEEAEHTHERGDSDE